MFIAPPLILVAFMLGGLHRRLTRDRVPPPDPAFRKPVDKALAADEHWAGIETSWLRFLDDWPVLEEDQR